MRSERVRIISLIVALATLGVVVLLRALLSGDVAQIRLLPYSGLIIGGGILYEAAMLRLSPALCRVTGLFSAIGYLRTKCSCGRQTAENLGLRSTPGNRLFFRTSLRFALNPLAPTTFWRTQLQGRAQSRLI